MNVHFIAIGGAAMHNLAIALSKRGHEVTGSDDEIFDPAASNLSKYGLLPEEPGWFPEKITKNLDAVILGMHAREDNPELLKAKELNIKIYSYPEFLFNQTENKTRVVIGGSHGKTTVTSMIIHVLKQAKILFDYMVGAKIDGFENMVNLSDDSIIAVFEGDEYLTSPIDKRPKFHLYRPNIALVTGIAWDHYNAYPTFDSYVEQFKKFSQLIEKDGKFIYFENDIHLKKIANTLREDITPFPYDTHPYIIKDGITYLTAKKGTYPIKIFGEHNLQNIQAAHIVCSQLGVSDKIFYNAISTFTGAANRLEKLCNNDTSIAFTDFAHSPSKTRATVNAVKTQFPDKKITACLELHTFSSLSPEFLPQYKDTLEKADYAFIYINSKTIKNKRLDGLSPEEIIKDFNKKGLEVFTDSELLKKRLTELDYANNNLLFMSSGNFNDINLKEFSKKLFGLS